MKIASLNFLVVVLITICCIFCINSSNGQTYCVPTFTYGCSGFNNWHNDTITLNTLNWTVDTADCDAYDYTTINTPITIGLPYTMQVKNEGFAGCTVWIDLDNDGTFEPGENFYYSYAASSTGFETYSFTLTLPAGTLPGPHRMRVLCGWGTDGVTTSTNGYGPCGTVAYQYGNFDDFTINATTDTCIAQPAAFTTYSDSFCQGSASVIYTVPTDPSALSYTWSYSGTGATFSSTSNTVAINFDSSATGGVLSVVANAACGASLARTMTVSATPTYAGDTISGPSVVYSGGTISLSFLVAGGTWSSNNAAIATVSPAGVVTPVAAGIDTISYTVSNSCGTFTFTKNITVDISSASTYCTPVFINGCTNWHNDSIVLNTLTWVLGTTDCTTDDYSATSTTLTTGIPYAMHVASDQYTGCTVWADLDNDGIFEPSENLYHNYVAIASGYNSYSFTITIPAGTLPGPHRLRVLAGWGTDGISSPLYGYGPCGTVAYQYGNYDDFTINVTADTCIGQPAAFTTYSDAVCQGSTGIIYTVPADPLALSYTWSYSGSGATFTSTTNTVAISFDSSATGGTLSVVANAACGGSIARTMAVSVTPTYAGDTISGTSVAYSGGTISLSFPGAGGNWSSGDASVATVSTTGIVTPITTGTDIITYTVSNSCGVFTFFKNITIDSLLSGSVYCIPTFINGCSGFSSWHNDTILLNTLNWTVDTADCAAYDYTAMGTTLYTGVAYPMQVTTGYFTGCTVWVDLNNDGIFEPEENLYNNLLSATGVTTYSFTVTIPPSTLSGPHRMRVLSGWGTDGVTTLTNGYGPCGTVPYQYGNFDDFTINVLCTTPVAGIISGADSIYLGGSAALSTTGTGGIWTSSNTAIATVDPTSGIVAPIATGTDTITYTATNSCGTASATKIITVSILDGISGHIYLSGAPCTGSNITIWLITYDTATHELAAADSVLLPCSAPGVYYQFTGVSTDSFRIKAAVDNDSLYSYTGYVPTYHTSSFYWDTAAVLYHTTGTADTGQNINMAYGTVTPGPGFIAGNVTMGANKGTSSTIPVQGMQIFALNQATGALIQQTYTDAEGNYAFNNLATGITYKLYPEKINFTTIPFEGLALTSVADTMTNINFVQHNLSLTITPAVMGVNNVAAKSGINIYPNPSSGVLNINWIERQQEQGMITISDIAGRALRKTTLDMAQGSGTSHLYISDLEDGVYIINITSGAINYNYKIVLAR